MVIVDSYPESNFADANSLLYLGYRTRQGQSFTGNGGVVNSAQFYLRKAGSPTGNLTAKIYSHSGTFGTSSLPTGTALATSDITLAQSLPTNFALVNFTFSGANKIVLTNSTNFCLELYGDDASTDGTNYLLVGRDQTSPTHPGNNFFKVDGSDYYASTQDFIFYVYADIISPLPTFFR